jgi:hypothetical protein
MTAYGWLIEAPGQRYLATRKVTTSHEFVWSQDYLAAIRFHSEEQADSVMMAVRQLAPDLFGFERTIGNARPVEHAWMELRSLNTECPSCKGHGRVGIMACNDCGATGRVAA